MTASATAPLYGLVLAGGRSTRMKSDKAVLVYHGRPQAAHTLDLLSAHCDRVFLSCRADQGSVEGLSHLPQLHDTYSNLGPLGGILTAMEAHPDAAWLVAACDLPYLDHSALNTLVAGRDPASMATAFAGPQRAGSKSAHGGGSHGGRAHAHGPPDEAVKDGVRESLGPGGELPEPLLAIYEPRFHARILELMRQGIDCPRKAMIKSPCRILPAPDPRFLANVNHPEEFKKALDDLSRPRA